MSVSLTENVRIAGDMQEKIEELRAMFPELSVSHVKELLTAHGGDLMQIVDKLLLQPSPPKSTSTPALVATQGQTSETPGNPASHGLGAASINSTPSQSHQSATLISKPTQIDSPTSPWGAPDSPQKTQPHTSAFTSQRAPTPPSQLEESYSVPLTPITRPLTEAVSPAESLSGPQSAPALKPLLRSLSPPKARHSTFSSLPKDIPRQADHLEFTSSGRNASHESFPSPSGSLTSAPPMASSLEPATIPLDNMESHTLLTVERPSKSQLLLVHPTPGTPTTPARESSMGPLTSHSPWSTLSTSPGSQMSASLSSSRMNDDRNARLRAAEAQFQMLMASVSEMDNVQQMELDRQEARIHQLEAEMAALTAEKSTWSGRLQSVGQASIQLRETITRQTSTIEHLNNELHARDQTIAALNAKIASFQPIEEAEALRAKFETTLQQHTSQQQGDDLRHAMELFASTFQQALAASLLSTPLGSQSHPKE